MDDALDSLKDPLNRRGIPPLWGNGNGNLSIQSNNSYNIKVTGCLFESANLSVNSTPQSFIITFPYLLACQL